MSYVLEIKREALDAQLPPDYAKWEKQAAAASQEIFEILMALPNGGAMAKAMAYSFFGCAHLKGFGEMYNDAMDLTQIHLANGTMSIIVQEKL